VGSEYPLINDKQGVFFLQSEKLRPFLKIQAAKAISQEMAIIGRSIRKIETPVSEEKGEHT
jgi:hypothetical protein